MSSTPMQEPSTSSSTNRKAKAKRRRRIGCEFLTDSRRGVLIEYDPASYIVTATGNKIEKSGDLRGLERIMVAGKTILEKKVTLRSDLATISIGQYCLIGENTVLQPAGQEHRGQTAYMPMQLGDYTIIERDCFIQAAAIGSKSHIAKNVRIGPRCVLFDCCSVTEGSVLKPGTIVPPYCVFSGNPAVFVAHLPPTFGEECVDHSREYFRSFRRQS